MQFDQLLALLPLSKIDPDPAELTDRVAEATLNAYQLLWHPALVHRAATLPCWARAASPPEVAPGRLILIPEPSQRFLPSDWIERMEAAGSIVVAGEVGRDRFLACLRERLPELVPAADPARFGDFLALGLARLWIEMLTAYMKHAATLDEDHFRKEVLAAAAAALLNEEATCDNHLGSAFRLLTEARERLYGVDVHLLDFCLLDPQAGIGRLASQLNSGQPTNFFLSGSTAEWLRRHEPAVADQLQSALERGTGEIVGGEFDEVASTLLPLESHLWQFRRGDRAYREALGREPSAFGRRRFGLGRHVLQLLSKMEIVSLAHFCFDDGVFPATREATLRLETPETSVVEALTRVPVSAERPVEYLKFPARLAQTMTDDMVATLALAHWPMPELPWYRELLLIARHANVFCRFTSLSNYFQTTDRPTMSTSYASDQYASPWLAQAHQRGCSGPVSQFARHHRRRARFDTLCWLTAVARALRSAPAAEASQLAGLEELVENRDAASDATVEAAAADAARALAAIVSAPRPDAVPGTLVFNSLNCPRSVLVPVPGGGDSTQSHWRSVRVPAMGFAWVAHAAGPAAIETGRPAAVVEGQTLSNGILEVDTDGGTGGIRAVRDRSSRIAALGQQLVVVGLRGGPDYSRDATPGLGDYAGYATQTCKSVMRVTSTTVTAAGPELAEVIVEGDLVAEPCPTWTNDPRVARFRQRYRLVRGDSIVRVQVEILDLASRVLDPRANPWECYVAARFAWPDRRSLLVRGVGSLAETSRAPRPESPHFIELHDRRHRAVILPGGLPFHQRVGDRMLDVLLVTATERCREFEFGVGVDLPNPFDAALDLITPPAMIACAGPPPGGPAGWFFHLDVPNAVVTSMTPLEPDRVGVRLRLFETAGRYTRGRLRCVRNVRCAQATDFRGRRTMTIEPEGDTLPVDLAPREFTQIEIEFA